MKTVHYAVVLGLICTLAAFGVAGSYRMTRERIVEKVVADQERARADVVAVADGDEGVFSVMNPEADPVDQVVVARNEAGDALGYAALGQAQGYGGMVNVMVGMDADAERIIGVKVVKQSETPGLGTRIAEVKSNRTWFGIVTGQTPEGEVETMSEFLKKFIGREESQVRLDGENSIQAITGATISSTAVVNAVRAAMQKIQKQVPGADEAQATTGAPITDGPFAVGNAFSNRIQDKR